MNPLPDEAPTFRGKTLTPESPRPLHIPEPSNIPLLQIQMEPSFQQTATYGIQQGSGIDLETVTQQGANTGSQTHTFHHANAYDQSSANEPSLGAQSNDGGNGAVEGSQPAYNQMLNQSSNPGPDDHALPLPSSLDASTTQLGPDGLTDQLLSTHNTLNSPSSIAHATFVAPSAANKSISNPSHEQISQEHAAPPSHRAHDTFVQTTGEIDHNGVSNLQSTGEFVHVKSDSSPAPSATHSAANLEETIQAPPLPTLAPQAGLPPRPPPQDKPSIHPNYSPSDNIRSFHQLPSQNGAGPGSFQGPQGAYRATASLPMPQTAGAPGTLPSTGSATSVPGSSSADHADNHHNFTTEQHGRDPHADDNDDVPWGPDIQKKYDEFLVDERKYVTEGLWDRFPMGSRLFVGNLPTERVTKRDMFHLFHRHGRLAQISIKQAYGFIQFLESTACRRALEKEQGALIRGRKIHLEISKPQKNTRQAGFGEQSRAQVSRRSRSPEARGRGLRSPRGRYARGDRDRGMEKPHFSDYRDEPSRRRDDYRPSLRSPSPRGSRRRDEYRGRNWSPERLDRRDSRRSRSPEYGRAGRHRSPSPRMRELDADASLPIPPRNHQNVPDVQIIVVENVDNNFVYHVEKTLRDLGLRCEALLLNNRTPLDAVIRRQILEGVTAVVKILRQHQFSGKISLQVFDRSGGVNNVRFNEYADLEIPIAAEVVRQAIQIQRGVRGSLATFTPYPALPAQAPQNAPPQQQIGNQPNLANLISNLDGASLQTLLGVLQQPPNQQPNIPAHPSGRSGATPQISQMPFPQPGQSVPPAFHIPTVGQNQPGANGFMPQGEPSPNVQNIMAQLSKWKS